MKNITYSGVMETARNVEAVHTHTHTHTGNFYVRGKINKSITIFLLFIIFIILNTGNAKAVLQSNGNTSATYSLSDWMLNVRKMEELGGAMGLSETLNSDLTSSSESNNIDVHMEKNTEYGALVILSASSYGNPNVIADGETTTGNATGVVMSSDSEWVAANIDIKSGNIYNAVARYKNIYATTYEAKIGDAILETESWHNSISTISSWFKQSQSCGIIRYNIFGFRANGGPTWGTYYGCTYSTRAVVVSGKGL